MSKHQSGTNLAHLATLLLHKSTHPLLAQENAKALYKGTQLNARCSNDTRHKGNAKKDMIRLKIKKHLGGFKQILGINQKKSIEY